MPEHQRKQQQWPTFGIVGDDDEGQEVLALSDLPLPGAEEIEPLIRRRETSLGFEAAPDGFRLVEIVENLDAGKAARLRLRCRLRAPAFDRGSHGHREACHQENIYIFPLRATFAKKCQQSVMTMHRGCTGVAASRGVNAIR